MPTSTTYMPWYEVDSKTGTIYQRGFSTDSFITSGSGKKVGRFYTGYNFCEHFKVIKPFFRHSTTVYWHRTNYCDVTESARTAVRNYGLSQAVFTPSFQKNNSFELIPFLVDFDSTLAMFSKKMADRLKPDTYGEITWGLLPFLSDVKSLVSTLVDINKGLVRTYNKMLSKPIRTIRNDWTYNFYQHPYQYEVDGSTVVRGYLEGELIPTDQEALPRLLIYLDELGVHPDLKTLWDVIPLSFVVDYFIPIGDMLESLHPRGWFNPKFTITGGYSVKAEVKHRLHSGYISDVSTWKYYYRTPAKLSISNQALTLPNWTAPSMKEVFNTLYLSVPRIVSAVKRK